MNLEIAIYGYVVEMKFSNNEIELDSELFVLDDEYFEYVVDPQKVYYFGEEEQRKRSSYNRTEKYIKSVHRKCGNVNPNHDDYVRSLGVDRYLNMGTEDSNEEVSSIEKEINEQVLPIEQIEL